MQGFTTLRPGEIDILSKADMFKKPGQDVEEARAISRPEDAIAALKKFTAYLKKNINDLASMASFEGENYDQPYVDERFEGFLSKADGTPVTPIFNEGGKLTLVGSNKQYLNIPTALYYRYPAFMYGGTIENDIMQLLGYKQKGIAEAEAKTMYRVIYNGHPLDILIDTMQQAQMIARKLEQKYGGTARVDHTVDVPKEINEKQDACYRKVKSRYKVWPSAYASGALVQCRKKGAANWGTGGKKK